MADKFETPDLSFEVVRDLDDQPMIIVQITDGTTLGMMQRGEAGKLLDWLNQALGGPAKEPSP